MPLNFKGQCSASHVLLAFRGPCFFACRLFLLCHQFHPFFCIISISIPSLLFILQKMSSFSVSCKSSCVYLYVLSRPFLGIVSIGCFYFLTQIHSVPIPFPVLPLCFDLRVARCKGQLPVVIFWISQQHSMLITTPSWDTCFSVLLWQLNVLILSPSLCHSFSHQIKNLMFSKRLVSFLLLPLFSFKFILDVVILVSSAQISFELWVCIQLLSYSFNS